MLTLDVSIEKLRDMIRISSDALDDELIDLKNAFLLDLSRVGVEVIPTDTALVLACLRLYLRWQENYNGEAERYKDSYRNLRNGLAQAGEYEEGSDADDSQ